MKNDTYLNLCLEQATQSPLHYRHGCIVVKGGKVVGQGFNDYRPGYNGGALKTGRLPTGSFPLEGDGSAVAKFKQKRKSKKPDDAPPTNAIHSTETFTPYERMGGGHGANVCLSMHAEMMAIHSALASTTALASDTVSHIKPSFKLPRGGSKSKSARGLRRADAVTSYVERVCLEASGPHVQQGTGTAQGQEKNGKNNNNNNNGNKYNKRSNSHARDTSPPRQQRGNDNSESSISNASARTKLCQTAAVTNTNYLLVPTGRARQSRKRILERMKHPKLVGADVYVARLCNSPRTPAPNKSESTPAVSDIPDTPEPPSCCPSPTLSTVSLASSTSTGSLHDELTCMNTRKETTLSPTVDEGAAAAAAVDSRPCYRCVSYMQNVGIKRVFWTNGKGEWEGAKVRDLVDMLEGSFSGSGEDGVAGLGVFVTKHEVLMLRRLMMSSSS
ncbi:hypothetical protein QBC46DRAFT_431494 [Diplogelasinospora grovesii]|uniref:CMP/dCMP-type deaminase domain-containing protein n=1 Tax=Diplogelasinospora grovesii TaxID=303347 RepID=A0AAN6MUU8_9PEZI|nr:hypothetical protein QBC46DRAFT_431494 [Diplogelasinospora grovesii]